MAESASYRLIKIPADKLIDLAARLTDLEKYLADEADAPGAERFRDDVMEWQQYLWSCLDQSNPGRRQGDS